MRRLLTAALVLVVVSSLTWQTTIVNAQDGSATSRRDDNKSALPVKETHVLKKRTMTQTIDEWFEEYAESAQAALTEKTNVAGYDAVMFFASNGEVLQRGLAIDLGNGQIVMHLTTDRKASRDELVEDANQFIGEALQLNAVVTTENSACNCVVWARSQVPLLPPNLTSYSQKLAIINHRFPRVGSVAVIYVPTGPSAPYGHVAVVRGVAINSDGSLKVTLQEANWSPCAITWRTGTPESLRIQGFFDPAYPSGAASPKLDQVSPSSGSAGFKFYTTASGLGFEATSAQGIILGGWCDSFYKCVVPNNVMPSRSSTSLRIPLTLGAGKYMLYIFNSSSGKTSNGKPITIN